MMTGKLDLHPLPVYPLHLLSYSSEFYHTHDNFLVYGGQGMKNDFGGNRCVSRPIADMLFS
jgi:hypothetical protein